MDTVREALRWAWAVLRKHGLASWGAFPGWLLLAWKGIDQLSTLDFIARAPERLEIDVEALSRNVLAFLDVWGWVIGLGIVLFVVVRSEMRLAAPSRASLLPVPPLTGVPAWMRLAIEPRVFVGPEVTVAFLTGLYKDRTEVQGRALTKPYIGKWMRYAGIFEDLREAGWPEGATTMAFKYEPTPGDLPPWYLSATFDKSWRHRLEILTPGTTATVIGKISRISDAGVILDECELVEPRQDAR